MLRKNAKRASNGKFIADPNTPSTFNRRQYEKDYRKKNINRILARARERWQKIKDDKEQQLLRRERDLKQRYGISLKQYEELLEKQHNKCFICERHHSEFKNRLHVDHNHTTGEIRGLLCYICNNKIIGRIIIPEIFDRAAAYLRQEGTGWFAPKKKKTIKRRSRRKLKPQDIIETREDIFKEEDSS